MTTRVLGLSTWAIPTDKEGGGVARSDLST
jgi:hypothetical protein